MEITVIFLAILCLIYPSIAKSQSSLECGACQLLVNQLELKIVAIDPKKKIEVGSYRVSPDGQQKGLKEISYARSDSHLIEIIENVCDEAKNYKLVVNTLTGKSIFTHKDSTYLTGDSSKTVLAKLQNACDDFIDSYEDELIRFLKNSHSEPVKQFCHSQLGVCTSVDVSPLPPNDPPSNENEPMTLQDIPTDEL